MKIRATRDSVCMGDDCNAPHETFPEYVPEQGIMSLLNAAAEYLPKMSDIVWTVSCQETVLGFLTSGEDRSYTAEPYCTDEFFRTLNIREIRCRHYYDYEFGNSYPDCNSLLEKVKKSLKE